MDDYQFHLYEEARAGRLTRRQLLRRASVAGLSMTAIGPLLGACGDDGDEGGATDGSSARPTGTPRRGGSMIVALNDPGTDLDPVTMNQVSQYQTVQCSAEYLCFPDASFGLQPQLATEWASKQSGKEWTFTLRPDVRFHDDAPLTAADVVASIERVNDPENGSGALAAFSGILSPGQVEAQGENTVAFHLDRPYVEFPYLVSAFNAQTVILPASYRTGSFSKGNIGSGPFILRSYTPKVGAQFVRNPSYWQSGRPYLDSLEIKFFADSQARNLALRAGSVDIIPATSGEAARQFAQVEGIKVLESQDSVFSTLQMRVDIEPFQDQRLREAVALGIDRDALLEGIYKVSAELGNDHGFAPVFPASADVVTGVPQRQRDVARARQLVADAGYPDGLSVELMSNRSGFRDYAVALKQMLKPVGILVDVNLVDDATWYGSGDNQPWVEVPFGITGWASRGTASQLIETAFLGDSPWNSAHWKNAEFDRLMTEEFDAQQDEQKRRQTAVQAAQIMHDEVPDVIAYWQGGVRAVRDRVNDVAAGPSTTLEMSGVWVTS